MKKILLIAVATLSLAMFMACGSNNGTEYDENNDTDTIMNESGPDGSMYDQDPGDAHNGGVTKDDVNNDDMDDTVR